MPAYSGPDLETIADWEAEARDILVQSLPVLRTNDLFVSYRISAAPESQTPVRSATEPAWFPPTSAAWETARQATEALRPRGQQLHRQAATSDLDERLWRERRALAAVTLAVSNVTEGLVGFRAAADALEPRVDGSGTLQFLTSAWDGWMLAAERLDLSATELVACA